MIERAIATAAPVGGASVVAPLAPRRSISHGAQRWLVAAAIAVAILGAVAATRMGTSPSPEQAWRAYCSIYVVGLVGALLAALVGWQMPNTVEDHEAYDEATVTGLLE